MKKKKHSLSVEVDYINEDSVKGVNIKNLKIENLSIPVVIMIAGIIIQRIKEHIEEIEEEDTLHAMAERLALDMTIAGVMSGQLNFDELSDNCKKDFLEHCFNMEQKG